MKEQLGMQVKPQEQRQRRAIFRKIGFAGAPRGRKHDVVLRGGVERAHSAHEAVALHQRGQGARRQAAARAQRRRLRRKRVQRRADGRVQVRDVLRATQLLFVLRSYPASCGPTAGAMCM